MNKYLKQIETKTHPITYEHEELANFPEIGEGFTNTVTEIMNKHAHDVDMMRYKGLRSYCRYILMDNKVDYLKLANTEPNKWEYRFRYTFSDNLVPGVEYEDLLPFRLLCDQHNIDYMKLEFDEFIQQLRKVLE